MVTEFAKPEHDLVTEFVKLSMILLLTEVILGI